MTETDFKVQLTSTDEASKFILNAFKQRRIKNPRYSIRSFALFLTVDHSTLTKFIKGTKDLSLKAKIKSLEKLGADAKLIDKLYEKQGRIIYEDLDDQNFQILSNWVHFAIIELFTIPGFTVTAKSVSKFFDIPTKEASECLTRLVNVGFISATSTGYKLLKSGHTFYPKKKTSTAKINFQKDILKLSQDSLTEIDFDKRDHSCVILALNQMEMALIKKWITHARRQLVQEFQKNSKFDDVYCFQISLFPLSKKR